jgi:hypothetical protein
MFSGEMIEDQGIWKVTFAVPRLSVVAVCTRKSVPFGALTSKVTGAPAIEALFFDTCASRRTCSEGRKEVLVAPFFLEKTSIRTLGGASENRPKLIVPSPTARAMASSDVANSSFFVFTHATNVVDTQ